MFTARNIVMVIFYLACSVVAHAEEESPYAPARVIYDLTSPDPQIIEHTLDRASLLQNIYDHDVFNASIVIVIHEGAIPHFAGKNKNAASELIRRANSLALGDIIEFRLCRASAKLQGYENIDFPEFVKVIPMADAEMVQLQLAGYAYLN